MIPQIMASGHSDLPVSERHSLPVFSSCASSPSVPLHPAARLGNGNEFYATGNTHETNAVASTTAQMKSTTGTPKVPSHQRAPYEISRGGGSARACHGCRQIKGKCDGNGVSCCRRCLRLNLTCKYPEQRAVQETRGGPRKAKRKAVELPSNPPSEQLGSSTSSYLHSSNSSALEETSLSLSHQRDYDSNTRGLDTLDSNQNQISWVDFLRRPEMATCIRSEGWIDQLRTLLLFALRNDDTTQLGYVLVMAGPSGLTLRDLIHSPAEQTHAIQLMFGGTRAPSPLLNNGAQYAPMIHELNDASLEQSCGPLPSCLEWIRGAHNCAMLLRCTSGDGTTNFFVNNLFLSTVQSKENIMKALATNRVPISGLTPSEQEKLMSVVIRGVSDLKNQPPICDKNGSSAKVLRFELQEKGIVSLGSSFMELVINSTGGQEFRYICVCVRPKRATIEESAVENDLIDFQFSPGGAEEELPSDTDLIAAVLGDSGDDGIRKGGGDNALEVLDI